MTRRLSRRTVLRGAGVGIGLPWLEAMGPVAAAASAAGDTAAPLRLAFLYIPNGIAMDNWTPKAEGPLGELPEILQEVKDHAGDINVISGLAQRPASGNPGAHARAMATFLTGVPVLQTTGTNYRAGVSADQVAAAEIGHRTRLASLEVGTEENTGFCDFGFHCVYKGTMSWRSPTQPMIKEVRPQQVFERLFGGADPKQAKRNAFRTSVLDSVREDARQLAGKLGSEDRRRMDEFLVSIRDIEDRIKRAAEWPPLETPDLKVAPGIPQDWEEHCRLLCDLIVLAFQADITRISTFALANELTDRKFPGTKDGHHNLTHAGNYPALTIVARTYTRQVNYLLGRLKAVREGEGTLLDRSLIAYGSAISDGGPHSNANLPILVAGSGGGTVKTGRHIRCEKDTPLNNLWLSMLDRAGVRVPKLGDSTGLLQDL